MGESMRCPYCGWVGATRVESVREYSACGAPPGLELRGRLLSQTDRFECEQCGETWDEMTYRRAPSDGRRVSA
jgi:predicted RNA-binding Zn-ribbon protein involved in translation (DUF1610 family)